MKHFLFAAVILFTAPLLANQCQLGQAQTLSATQHAVVKLWTLPVAPILFSTYLPDDASFIAYRKWVMAQVKPDPILLLQRQLDVYKRLNFEAEIKKHQLVIDGQIGKIYPITCLEALLLSEHTSRFPLEQNPTEFLAFIVQRDQNLKIYLSSHDDKTAQGPALSTMTTYLKNDLTEGWVFSTNLHNHPFFFKDKTGDIAGTTLPSGAGDSGDIFAFNYMLREFGLQHAWITNGFSTIKLSPADIRRLALMFPHY